MCLCVVSELQASPAPLPSDHLLRSGAVIFPGKSCGHPLTHSLLCVARSDDSVSTGVFDQHGCPLVVFPAEAQGKLSEELSTEEVSHFIHYCLRLHKYDTLLSLRLNVWSQKTQVLRNLQAALFQVLVHAAELPKGQKACK